MLDKGEIAERGTHAELLALRGKYHEIYELQLRPQEEVMRDIDVSETAFAVERGAIERGAVGEGVAR